MRKKFSALGQIIFILKFVAKFLWDTDKRSFILVTLLNIVFSATIIPNLILDKYFLDILIGNIGKPNPQQAFHQILWIVAARLGLQLVSSLANRLSGYYARFLFWRQYQRLETMIGQKYATVSVPTIEDPTFKDRYHRVERESLNRMQTITNNFVRIPQYLSGAVSTLSIFIISQPIIALLAVVSLVPSVIVDRIFIKKEYVLETEVAVKHRLRGMYYYFLGRGRSYMESRILNIHPYLADKIRGIWDEIIALRSKVIGQRRFWSYLADIVDEGVSYSFDAVFAFQAIVGAISVGTAQAYIRAIGNFKSSISGLTSATLELYENYMYIDDLVWFLNLPEPYSANDGKVFGKTIKQGIKFDHVWFKYPGSENWILQDVSFEINSRENLALVGENGSGKTTLVKLLSGFYEPSKGQILIDNTPIAKFNRKSYWQQLSILFQEFDTYGINARESIAASNISDVNNITKIKKYAQMSDIDAWIEELPLHYDNPLLRDFEKGVNPSAGQWQRIGIARILFKESQIVVLDEPTSNVDPKAEEDIFNHILSLGRDKILVFISHRFSTVRKADRIVLLEKGKLVEQGTHEELMKKKSHYAKLFNLQAKSYQ